MLPAISAKPCSPGHKRVHPGRTFWPGQYGGAHERPDVPGTGRSRERPADLPLRAEPAASTTAREHLAAAMGTGTMRLGASRARPQLTLPPRGALPAGFTVRDGIGRGARDHGSRDDARGLDH